MQLLANRRLEWLPSVTATVVNRQLELLPSAAATVPPCFEHERPVGEGEANLAQPDS
jgi:hypothetical protein